MGGGWEKNAGGRKSNVSDKTLCFFEGWQFLPMAFHLLRKLIFNLFDHQLACNGDATRRDSEERGRHGRGS